MIMFLAFNFLIHVLLLDFLDFCAYSHDKFQSTIPYIFPQKADPALFSFKFFIRVLMIVMNEIIAVSVIRTKYLILFHIFGWFCLVDDIHYLHFGLLLWFLSGKYGSVN
jgi:hypothetical protein